MKTSLFKVLGVCSAVCAFVGMGNVSPINAAKPAASPIYGFTVQNIDGKNVKLSKYKGKVILIVNVASKCGNTPQYAALEALYEKYKSQGFVILGFPENDFMGQEPGDNKEIKAFCTGTYHVKFDMFSKIDVKGDTQAPLYKYLTDPSTDPQFGGPIDWNFAKFLISRDGKIVDRFQAGHKPDSDDVITAIEQQLAVKG